MMDSVRDEALNSVFNALLWGGFLLPLFLCRKVRLGMQLGMRLGMQIGLCKNEMFG